MKNQMYFYIFSLVVLLYSCSSDSEVIIENPPIDSILEYKILGSQTDQAINDIIVNDSVVGPNEGNHAFINESVNRRNKLFLFFPGTNSLPSWHKSIGKKAASMGYHAIILRYNSSTPIFTICGNDPDIDCHKNARMEVLTGQDLNNNIMVDEDHSIENRLIKLLQYLSANNPDQNWDQFLTSDDIINWSSIVVSGHSQGGGYAGLLSKQHLVEKAIMFSAADWHMGAPANWVTEPGQTPPNKMYAFVHLQDEAGYFGPGQIIEKNWQGYGIDAFGGVINVDNVNPPYNNSHTLVTSAETVNFIHWFHDDKYHNGVVVDPFLPISNDGLPLFDAVWEYMLE